MKTKPIGLTLVFGFVVALFACQDQGVVAPTDDGEDPTGLVNLRIGGYMLFDYGYPTVNRTSVEDGDGNVIGETHTFSGGSVGVVSREAKPNKRLTIVCKLLDP
jgi:hypothetical protein